MSQQLALSLPQRWFLSLRPYSFPASFVPIALTAVVSAAIDTPRSWWAFSAYAVSATLLHAGANVLNDYYDHLHGVDGPPAADRSHVIARGLVSARFMLITGHAYFLIAISLGLMLALLRGPGFLLGGVAAVAAAFFYTGRSFSLKYCGLGDIVVFITMGLLHPAMGVFATTGSVPPAALVLAIPLALPAVAILHGNNLRDRDTDRAAGVRTIANLLPLTAARALFAALTISPYLLVLLLVAGGYFEPVVGAVFLSLPFAVFLVGRVFVASDLTTLPVECAALYLGFSLLYLYGILAFGAPV